MGRLFLLLVVALCLAPGTWLRAGPRVLDRSEAFAIEPLEVPDAKLGELEVAGAWQLSSPNYRFGAYSGLLAMGDGTLVAVSDAGRKMRLAEPSAGPVSAILDDFGALPTQEKHLVDAESVTRDPASGTIWAGYEGSNQIVRYDARFRANARVRPAEMRTWPGNSGPEALVRLADGRFVVLSEGSPRWLADEVPALLFPADPVDGARPIRFRFRPPAGFSPVDIAQLPDGRLMILLRTVRLGLPPRFENKLMIADPALIRPGELWPARAVADLAEPLPMDNYEGLAIEAAPDGSAVLWLISDNNQALLQRTLLLKLLWRGYEKGARN